MGVAKRFKAVLLMEGLSIPVIRWQISASDGQPATGMFDLVPLREITRIRPRTYCQLFIWDLDGDEPQLVLAYDGEVYGYGTVKEAARRSFRIHTMDVSSYWDNAKLHFFNAVFAAGMDATAFVFNRTGVDSKQINTFVSKDVYIIQLMTNYMSNLNKTDPDRFQKALIHVLYRLQDINAFYHGNSTRLRINDRISAESAGNLEAVFAYHKAMNLMKGMIMGSGGYASLRQCIGMIMGIIYHNGCTSLFPSWTTAPNIYGDVMESPAQFLFKPDAFMVAPPKCNVIFPNMYSSISSNRNFFAEPTRLMFMPLPQFAQGAKLIGKCYWSPYFIQKYFGHGSSEDEAEASYDHLPVDDKLTYAPGMSSGKGPFSIGNYPSGTLYNANPEMKKLNVSKSRYTLAISNEEVIKGHFPVYLGRIPATTQMVAADKDKAIFKDKSMQRLGEYMFYNRRFAPRTATATGRFNMAAVPGLPAVFIDGSDTGQTLIGMLTGVTHSGDGAGASMTQYQLTHCRFLEEREDYDSKRYAEAPIPPWYKSQILGTTVAFKDVKSEFGSGALSEELAAFVSDTPDDSRMNKFGIGLSSFYQNLIGIGAITNNQFKTILGAVLKLIQRYENEADKEKFAYEYTRRPYTTIEQMTSFLGATIQNADSAIDVNNNDFAIALSGGAYENYGVVNHPRFKEAILQRRNVIAAYRNRLIETKAFVE